MSDRNGKRAIIYVSSGDEDDDDEEDVEDDEYDGEDEEMSRDDASDGGDDDESESESDEENEESLCKRVVCFLQEGKCLESLSLKEYKAYLRKHGLRLAGTKAVCMERIMVHWRIKDGNGESLYPRSSFVINCTGDVCKGDVVLFNQKVYENYDKVSRHGNVNGRRTVAGKVVKESYGSAKQLHTFTVEVLWSKGVKKLPPLFPLLVKGRNLYKLKTFRQCWNNEAERLDVLAEKHKRGTAARLVRAMKKSKKKFSATGHLNGGVEHPKWSRHVRLSQTRKTYELEKRKHVNGHKKNTSHQHGKDTSCQKISNYNQEVPPSRQLNLRRNNWSDGYKPTWKHMERGHLSVDMDPALQAYAYTHQSSYSSRTEFLDRTAPFHFSGHDMGSTSIMMMPPSRPYASTDVMPALQYHWFNHRNDTRHDTT